VYGPPSGTGLTWDWLHRGHGLPSRWEVDAVKMSELLPATSIELCEVQPVLEKQSSCTLRTARSKFEVGKCREVPWLPSVLQEFL
jgi:hypothetical protein